MQSRSCAASGFVRHRAGAVTRARVMNSNRQQRAQSHCTACPLSFGGRHCRDTWARDGVRLCQHNGEATARAFCARSQLQASSNQSIYPLTPPSPPPPCVTPLPPRRLHLIKDSSKRASPSSSVAALTRQNTSTLVSFSSEAKICAPRKPDAPVSKIR